MCSTYPVTIIETSSLDKETFNEVTSSRVGCYDTDDAALY